MSKKHPSKVVEVGKALLLLLGMVVGLTVLIAVIIAALSGVAFGQTLVGSSILAVALIILWQKEMWVPKSKGG